eukprot:Colp12_sorted_trinity150504_noHs@33535
MEKAFNQASGTGLQIQHKLSELESGRDVSSSAQDAVRQLIDRMSSEVRVLEELCQKEPIQKRQRSWIRVQQLNQDYQGYATAFDQFVKRHRVKESEQKQREELLHRKFEPNKVVCTTTRVYCYL